MQSPGPPPAPPASARKRIIVRALALVVVLQLGLLLGQLGLVKTSSWARAPKSDGTQGATDERETHRRNTSARRMTLAERKWVSPFYLDAQRVTKAMLPNLVLMIADDLAFEDLGSYGATGGLTPHADQLARAGVRFAEAHTPSPLCTPSRYSLLTGQYSSCFFAQNEAARGRHAVTRQISLGGSMGESPELASIEFNINLCADSAASAAGRASGAAAANAANASLGAARAAPAFTAAAVAGRLPQQGEAPSEVQQSAVTLAQLLKQRGYATGFVGKWHLGYPPSNATAELRKRVAASPASAWRTVKDDVLREYRAVQAHVRRAGFDFAERLYVNNLYPEQHLLPSEMLHHNTEWVADGAAKFISMPRRSPFFLHVAFTLPHNPDAGDSLQADPRYTPGGLWACNRSAVAANREAVLRLVNAHNASGARHSGGGAPPREPRLGHRHYPLALAWMDSGIGLVVQALRASGHLQNSLVLFSSDHHSYDKRHCYTAGSKVPPPPL